MAHRDWRQRTGVRHDDDESGPASRWSGTASGRTYSAGAGHAGPAARASFRRETQVTSARKPDVASRALTASLMELSEVAARAAATLGPSIERALSMTRDALAGGGTLFFCGNGGSAADAQHLATEYVVRYMRDRPAMRAIALTTDTSLLTAAGNDLGFDLVFSRQIEALA